MSKRKRAKRSLNANECGTANTPCVLSEPILSPYFLFIVYRGTIAPTRKFKTATKGGFFVCFLIFSLGSKLHFFESAIFISFSNFLKTKIWE
ncbi:MAG: hypothetical protein ACLRFP_01955, partial [Alphaproteobacteria bacterium]